MRTKCFRVDCAIMDHSEQKALWEGSITLYAEDEDAAEILAFELIDERGKSGDYKPGWWGAVRKVSVGNDVGVSLKDRPLKLVVSDLSSRIRNSDLSCECSGFANSVLSAERETSISKTFELLGTRFSGDVTVGFVTAPNDGYFVHAMALSSYRERPPYDRSSFAFFTTKVCSIPDALRMIAFLQMAFERGK